MAADDGAVLGHAVVVGEDRAGADVGALTDLGVTDVGQVRHLGAVGDRRVLGLHERADLPGDPELRARPEVGERTDTGPVPDHRQLAVRADDAGVGADLAVLERGVGADHGVLAHHRRAQQLGAGEDRDVGLEHDVGLDPRRRGVHDRDAVLHPAGDDAAVELLAELGELGPVVGSLGLRDVVDQVRTDGQAVLAGQTNGVGQVVLALGVVVADPRERRDEERGVERQDPRVDLVDLALLGRRVLLLHDRLDVTLMVANDAAVAERVRHPAAQDAHRPLRRLVLGGERPQRLTLQQRGVAGRHDHGAGGRAGGLHRDAYGVPGAVLRLLDGQHRGRHQAGDVRSHLLALVPDDRDDTARFDGLHGPQHVADHGAPGDGVQHLHGLRLHAGAATGGEDDDGEVVHGRSLSPGGCRIRHLPFVE